MGKRTKAGPAGGGADRKLNPDIQVTVFKKRVGSTTVPFVRYVFPGSKASGALNSVVKFFRKGQLGGEPDPCGADLSYMQGDDFAHSNTAGRQCTTRMLASEWKRAYFWAARAERYEGGKLAEPPRGDRNNFDDAPDWTVGNPCEKVVEYLGDQCLPAAPKRSHGKSGSGRKAARRRRSPRARSRPRKSSRRRR